jgi:hypothetical protein
VRVEVMDVLPNFVRSFVLSLSCEKSVRTKDRINSYVSKKSLTPSQDLITSPNMVPKIFLMSSPCHDI